MKVVKILSYFAFFCVWSSASFAFSLERFQAEEHYFKMSTERKPNTVMEFFSYGCPHCNHLEPEVEKWLENKPSHVKFIRVPAAWNSQFEQTARLYFALQEMGAKPDIDKQVFDYLHKERKPIRNEEQVFEFVKSAKLDMDAFKKAWESEAVKSRLQESNNMYATYKVRGVPAVVVNGQYQTSVKMAGSEEKLFEVVNFLLMK